MAYMYYGMYADILIVSLLLFCLQRLKSCNWRISDHMTSSRKHYRLALMLKLNPAPSALLSSA